MSGMTPDPSAVGGRPDLVPSFFLFGEAPREVTPRFIHVESLDDRSRPSHWNIRAHAHAALNHVFLIEAGAGEMRAEARTFTFRAPCLLLIPSGVVHGFAWEPETSGMVLTLADPYLRELIGRDPAFARLFAGPEALPLDPGHDLSRGFQLVQRELGWSAPGHAAAVEAQLLALMVTALRSWRQSTHAAPATDASSARLVARFREAIEADYRSGISIEAFAERLGVTPTKLRRACWAVARATPIRLLHDRLLLEAKRALIYTNMSVAEIAFHLGFDDPAYFSRFFAKHVRVSPRAFRERNELSPGG